MRINNEKSKAQSLVLKFGNGGVGKMYFRTSGSRQSPASRRIFQNEKYVFFGGGGNSN